LRQETIKPRVVNPIYGGTRGVASHRSVWMTSPVTSGQVFRASTVDWPPSPFRPLGSPRTAPVLEFDGAVGDGQPEGRPDRAVHKPDFSPVGTDQFGRDGKSQPRPAGAG